MRDTAKLWPADQVERWPIERLLPYARNSRQHSDQQVAQIAASMREWGWTNPMLIGEDGTIIAGHGRLMAARQLGFTEAPVMIARGWTEAQKRAYVIADNQLALKASWDDEMLALELADLGEMGFNLDLVGFDDAELASLLAEKTEGLTDPDEVPEAPENPVSRLGDVWILGKHRLVCGDSTNADDVAKALNGVRPHLCVTDPPYGVEYTPDWRNQVMRSDGTAIAGGAVGKVLNDDKADWREAWALFPGDVMYVWHSGLYAGVVADSLTTCGFQLRSQIIWAKSNFAIGRGDYHWHHEPCQPAGTMVRRVIEPGTGSQPAKVEDVPIENLKVGDLVVSYNVYESQVKRRGRAITNFGERQYSGNLHTVEVAGCRTRATAEHQFSVRFDPAVADKRVVYLMRSGDRWRVGYVRLFNSRGFGLAVRMEQEDADAAWILSVHDDVLDAKVAEQVASCVYGIPMTHWVCDNKPAVGSNVRSLEHIAAIYAKIGVDRLRIGVDRLFADRGLDPTMPLAERGEMGRFSRLQSRRIRALNLVPGIMQVPVLQDGEAEWATIDAVSFERFGGPVYSMDVERDRHYVADGIVTHNCWYAVKGKGHWNGDRTQSTLWQIPKPAKSETGHSTQKPVECMKRPIENNSSPGQAIYEPFNGSGTTLIACEQTGRSAHCIELNPAYIDVTIQRWQNFAGQEATLEGDGRTFAEIAAERLTSPPA